MSQIQQPYSKTEPVMHMGGAQKRKMGLWSLIPVLAFLAWCLYILIINGRLIEEKAGQDHEKVVTLISHNYAGSLVLFLIAFAIGLAVLIYYAVHITRLKTMNGATKLAWLLFLTAFAPFSFPIFWWVELRREPDDIPVHPSIA